MQCEQCKNTVSTPVEPLLSLQEALNFLRSPNPLTTTQKNDISSFLSFSQTGQDKIDLQILRFESFVQHLRSRKESLKRCDEALRSLFAPIRNLPTEILVLIFSFFVTEESTFSNVSWKNPLIALPRYLQQSGNHPLDFEFSANSNTFLSHHLIRAINSLLDNASRWRSVTVENFFPRLQSRPPEPLPLLRRFERKYGDLGGHPADRVFLVPNAPRLVHLGLHTFDPLQDIFPWTQIQTLDLTWKGQQSRNIFDLLSPTHSQNLSSLTTLSFFIRAHEPCPHDSYPSPTVTSLTFDGTLLHGLISKLYLPALKSFTYQCGTYSPFPHPDLGLASDSDETTARNNYPAQLTYPIFSQFITNSQCTLTSLTLSWIRISESDLLKILTTTPTIEEFIYLSEPPPQNANYILLSPNFIKTLRGNNLSDSTYASSFFPFHPILPRLVKLNLQLDERSFREEDFVEMVLSRWVPIEYRGVRPKEFGTVGETGNHSLTMATTSISLTRVQLTVLGRLLDEEALEPLMKLRRLGLSLDMEGLDCY
ncbi:hypothetical protein D9758_015935 [Tetrapyrgos nigripes]|uniref:F-box domain-containing protein n=1 Tax=Tetrapyrgos nigripes TaxID=182062 RepID=A0A8H5C7Q0_9AGAR|nr:hypothetical protein D9758_015935 [Tetrapyrgos nigripes]